MIPIVDLKRQYKQTGAEIEKAVVDVLRSGAYILGPNTKASVFGNKTRYRP